MDITKNDDIILQVKYLQSENDSLRAQLLDYKSVIDARDREIAGLLKEAEEANILRSELDNKLEELQILQNHIGLLQQQAVGAAGRETEMDQYIKEGLSTEFQFADLKQQYTYLQTQLGDFQIQLQAVTDRNLILQQQLAQMTELESLLANAEEERDEWKKRAEAAEANKED